MILDRLQCSKGLYPFHDGAFEDFEPVFQNLIKVINSAPSPPPVPFTIITSPVVPFILCSPYIDIIIHDPKSRPPTLTKQKHMGENAAPVILLHTEMP